MPEPSVVRAVFGTVTHADGTTTCGMHVRNADGVLEYVNMSAETIDWERWKWAWQEAQRILQQRPESSHDAT